MPPVGSPAGAAAFSGFYIAMILTLMALFFRPVGFKYRSLQEGAQWRTSWDWALFAGSAIPPVIFGVAFGMGAAGAAGLGALADATSIAFVFQLCAFLPAIGLLTMFLPGGKALARAQSPG